MYGVTATLRNNNNKKSGGSHTQRDKQYLPWNLFSQNYTHFTLYRIFAQNFKNKKDILRNFQYLYCLIWDDITETAEMATLYVQTTQSYTLRYSE